MLRVFNQSLILSQPNLGYTHNKKEQPFKNIAGKGKNGKPELSPIPTIFLLREGQMLQFQPSSICCLQILSIWTN